MKIWLLKSASLRSDEKEIASFSYKIMGREYPKIDFRAPPGYLHYKPQCSIISMILHTYYTILGGIKCEVKKMENYMRGLQK